MANKFIAACAATSALIAGPAFAADAQLSGLKGQVMVHRAGKLAPASQGALKPGDRIVAMQGGQARLTYADGCVVTLKAQAMATIAATSPCAGGGGLVTAGPASAQADQAQGLSTLQWVGVGLTVVVLGVGIAAAADDLSISN